jgi:hypothetical protein
MKEFNHKIDAILDHIPNDRADKISYVEKIKKYRNECGCSMGAIFSTLSVVLALIYLVLFLNQVNANIIKTGIATVLCIFISGITGKLIGIGIARIKLVMLYRSIFLKYKTLIL